MKERENQRMNLHISLRDIRYRVCIATLEMCSLGKKRAKRDNLVHVLFNSEGSLVAF